MWPHVNVEIPDWNVVVTVRDLAYRRAKDLLSNLGPVGDTRFFNVLVMRVDDIHAFIETVRERSAVDDRFSLLFSRIAPATHTFDFVDAGDFERKADELVGGLTPELASASFHVRLHRRGHKEWLPSTRQEQRLDRVALEQLERAGTPGRIEFDDPDAVIVVDTVDTRAGLALWRRDDLRRYPFLRPDL